MEMQRERNDFMNFLLGDTRINVKKDIEYSPRTKELEKKLDQAIKKNKQKKPGRKILDGFKQISNLSKARQILTKRDKQLHQLTNSSDFSKNAGTPKLQAP